MKKICIIFLIFLSACTNLQKGNEKNSTHEKQTKNISSFYEEWHGVPYKYGGISLAILVLKLIPLSSAFFLYI